MAPCDAYRRLTLFLSTTCLISNLAAIRFYQHLPDDPLHLAWHLSLYSYFASVLAVLGFMGARKNNATLVTIFSNFVIIDTIMSTLPRLVAINLFPSIRSSICSPDTIHAWLKSETGSLVIATDEIMREQMIGQCRTVVGVLQSLAGVFALAVTVVQVLLAMRVNAYARILCRQEDMEQERKLETVEPMPVQNEKKVLVVHEKMDTEMA